MSQVIPFDKSARNQILSIFNKKIQHGYVIDNVTKEKVLAFDGNEMRGKDFAGIVKGSEIYIKSDIDSIIKFIQRTPQK